MELQRLCAYNQTRECFLGLEVAAADLSFAALKDLLGKLALKSGEGLWMSPFRGIPDTNMRGPLDLIYLDEDCRVIEVVESFPTFHVTPSSPHAASVLALADPLDLFLADAARRSTGAVRGRGDAATPGALFSPISAVGGVQSAVLLRESRSGAVVRALWKWRIDEQNGSFQKISSQDGEDL